MGLSFGIYCAEHLPTAREGGFLAPTPSLSQAQQWLHAALR